MLGHTQANEIHFYTTNIKFSGGQDGTRETVKLEQTAEKMRNAAARLYTYLVPT